MNYHVVIEGQAAGPYTPGQLAALGINGDTLIWYQGLENWVPASTVPEVMAAISSSAQGTAGTEIPNQPAVPGTPGMPKPQYTARPATQCPPNNLAVAIIGLVMFFPIGIPALIKAIRVSSLWNSGQTELAVTQSNSARRLGILAIIIGAVLFTLNIFALALG